MVYYCGIVYMDLIPLISQQIGSSELTRRAESIVPMNRFRFDLDRRQTLVCGTAITPALYQDLM
jgi:hypothetical protein